MGQQIASALHQSMDRVLVMLVRFLPGLLAFFLALVILWLIGWLVAALARRILVAAHFDERIAARERSGSATSLADWSPSNSPTLLVSRGVSVGLHPCRAGVRYIRLQRLVFSDA